MGRNFTQKMKFLLFNKIKITFEIIEVIQLLKKVVFGISRDSELKIRLSADKFDTRKVADFYPRFPFFVFLTMFKSIYI